MDYNPNFNADLLSQNIARGLIAFVALSLVQGLARQNASQLLVLHLPNGAITRLVPEYTTAAKGGIVGRYMMFAAVGFISLQVRSFWEK